MISLSMMTGESGVVKSSRRLRRHRQKLLDADTGDLDHLHHLHARACPALTARCSREEYYGYNGSSSSCSSCGKQTSLLCIDQPDLLSMNIDRLEKGHYTFSNSTTTLIVHEQSADFHRISNILLACGDNLVISYCNSKLKSGIEQLNEVSANELIFPVSADFPYKCCGQIHHRQNSEALYERVPSSSRNNRLDDDGDDDHVFGMTEWQAPRT